MTLPQIPSSPENPKYTEAAAVTVTSVGESSGWSLLQKLLFLGVIAGGVTIWLRARRANVGEKSLA